MSHQELAAALDVVHREIAESDHLDAADVAKLQATMARIQAVLDQRVSGTGPSPMGARVVPAPAVPDPGIADSAILKTGIADHAEGSKRGQKESLTESVSSSARRFEESHPVLTETLGRVADILQQMGI